jgi:hypothetical protein
MHFSRSAAHRPEWLLTSRTTAGKGLSERDVLRATRPGMDSGQPGGQSAGMRVSYCAGLHEALTVGGVRDAWLVAACGGVRRYALRADGTAGTPLRSGRNINPVTSAYWTKPQEPGSHLGPSTRRVFEKWRGPYWI